MDDTNKKNLSVLTLLPYKHNISDDFVGLWFCTYVMLSDRRLFCGSSDDFVS